MATDTDYSHRTTIQKLGLKPDYRVEVTGDVGSGLRRDAKEAVGRGLVRSGDLDAAIVMVGACGEADRGLAEYRPRLKDSGCLWILTRKRGHESYVNQMHLVPGAK